MMHWFTTPSALSNPIPTWKFSRQMKHGQEMFCRCCVGVTSLLLKREFSFETDESPCEKARAQSRHCQSHTQVLLTHTGKKKLEKQSGRNTVLFVMAHNQTPNGNFAMKQDAFGSHLLPWRVEKKASVQTTYIRSLRQQISQRGLTSTLCSSLLLLPYQELTHALLP